MNIRTRQRWVTAVGFGLVLLLVIAILAALVLPAGADTSRTNDPNDSPGVLDIASVFHGHKDNGNLVHTIRTHEGWDLDDVNSNDSLGIEIQLPGNNRTSPPERLIVIDVSNGELRARIYDTRGDPPAFIAELTLRKPRRDTVKVIFDPDLLRDGLASYKYRAHSYFEKSGTDCKRPAACQDDAPDARANGSRNWLRHDLDS